MLGELSTDFRCFAPKFKFEYDDLENIKTDCVNAVVFNLHQIKRLKFLLGHLVDRCDSNRNKSIQAPQDSEDCNTTQQYVLVDEYTIMEEIENAVKSNSAQIENLWKYFDILMDMISDDGERIKRIEERRSTPSGRPTPSGIPSTLSPAILFPNTPQASEASSVDSEPHEPCDGYENTQKSEQSFILQTSQNSGFDIASRGSSPDSGLNIFGDETMPKHTN